MCERGEWAKFRRYHYLNNDISNAAICYGLYDNTEIVAFLAEELGLIGNKFQNILLIKNIIMAVTTALIIIFLGKFKNINKWHK